METKGDELRLTIIYLTLGFLLLGGFIILFISLYRSRINKHIKEKVEMKNEFEKEILRTQLEIKEQTLKTVSQEIHDNIGQVLSLAKLNLNTMELTKLDELQQKISDSKILISKAIQDLRDLSRGMNTDNIEAMGLAKVIRYEMEMIRKTGFSADLNIAGSIIRMEPQKELIVFRIIQEVLNNIIKHSQATEIVTNLFYSDKEIKIVITDNGRGFDLTPLNENDNSNFGLGIRNMHNRAKLIGADFVMNSTIGKGTLVAITIPLNNHNFVNMEKSPTIALADDHVLLRKGLADLVSKQGFTVLFQADNGEEFLEKLKSNPDPDIVLLDINMPKKDGYETALWLKRNKPGVKVLALSMYDDENAIIRMLKNGARGYILKDAEPAELKAAIDAVLAKGFHYSEMVTGKLIHTIHTLDESESDIKNTLGLNEKEIKFLKLAATELTYKEIAEQMHLSPRTIDGYRDELFEKLNIKSRVGLVLFAIKNGIVTM